MAKVDLVMPKMGESIMEATILKWLKNPGDHVELDEPIVEIATDKVDSDIPSPVSGTIEKILFNENEIVEVGKVIAIIATEQSVEEEMPAPAAPLPKTEAIPSPVLEDNGQNGTKDTPQTPRTSPAKVYRPVKEKTLLRPSQSNRFYSPLVRTIAQREAISMEELESIPGTGANGRITKKDILDYVKHRESNVPELKIVEPNVQISEPVQLKTTEATNIPTQKPQAFQAKAEPPSTPQAEPARQFIDSTNGRTEIIEMDRMRTLIAEHMVRSKHTSPHVTSFIEVDVTNIVKWRESIKGTFMKQYGEKITYTPIFMEAVCKAIKDFPFVNCSLDGNKIIKKNYVNLGMATALDSGNLIVPVIKNADHLNLLGLTKSVNDLAKRARTNKLAPAEIQDGTFTLTNVGTFGNVMGTPIINQPQVAILAVGAIRKKPAVMETEHGDLIAVRNMMFLSLSYDHRIVDGYLGGSFLSRVGKYLEAFDPNRTI